MSGHRNGQPKQTQIKKPYKKGLNMRILNTAIVGLILMLLECQGVDCNDLLDDFIGDIISTFGLISPTVVYASAWLVACTSAIEHGTIEQIEKLN